MNTFFQQRRVFEAGGLKAEASGTKTQVEMNINLRCAKDDGAPRFTAELYNLAQTSWKTIAKGDPARIQLGWLESPFETVCMGVVEEKYIRPSDRDTKFVIKGVDESQARVENSYVSHTWQDPAPALVAREIAGYAGLAAGTIVNPGGTISGRYPILKEHSLNYWLDQLVKEANEIAGREWEWYASAGRLNFLPKEQAISQAIDIISPSINNGNGNAINVEEASGRSGKSEGSPDLEADIFLDPRITRDTLVTVQTTDYDGVYRVVDYEHQSAMQEGTHQTRAVLASADAQYEIDPVSKRTGSRIVGIR